MCDIIGYVGDHSAAPILVGGLKRMEYRGYDSAGIAVSQNNTLRTVKRAGKVEILAAAVEQSHINAHLGIGHTRWATHGAPSEGNAHPHVAGKIARFYYLDTSV